VVKLISIERMDSSFLVSLLTVCSLLRLQLAFECINIFKNTGESQRLLSGSSFGFKGSLFLLFKFGNYSAISCVVVVLVTTRKLCFETLKIFRRVAYSTGNRFRYPYYILVMRKDSDHWCALALD
jgi:hypothetical protein